MFGQLRATKGHKGSKAIKKNPPNNNGGAFVPQLVEHLTPDFSSGHDLRVVSSSPAPGSTLGVEPTLKKKEKKNPTSMLPSSFPFQVTAYSFSSSHFLCHRTVYRKGRLSLS